MTAPTATSSIPTTPTTRAEAGSGITFGRVLRSEWIKVTTVPSTVILIVITLVVMIGLAAVVAWSLGLAADAAPPGAAFAVPSSGLAFGQLLIASLAVVLVASEWGTGMIRSTMVAVPGRTQALVAKAAVIAAISFVVGLVSALGSYFVTQPILDAQGLGFALGEEGVFLSVVNTGTFLALVALISMATGTLLRNTAGGIVTVVGGFFVLPVVLQTLAGLADWVADVGRFLPGEAGQQMVAVTASDGALSRLEGGLTMAAWAIGLQVIALVVTKKRDV
ncbi:ABC transporter permease [Agromyces sp. C10]|uniref:ABC transporter permease n=1 Tax=Agromyces sp. C10 TaxID=2935077 RepID=UPI00200A2754|nr:ABC transporter permease [Agromyces sp. C10]MCK8608901.1 ABC transporter permease [Agromyces sp. C10]